MTRRIGCLLLLAVSCLATNINQFASSISLSVNNSTATSINAAIANTTTIQMYIKASSTAQIFTFSFPSGQTIEVPSGATLTLRTAANFAAGDAIGSVITATGAAVLQVIFIREVKQ